MPAGRGGCPLLLCLSHCCRSASFLPGITFRSAVHAETTRSIRLRRPFNFNSEVCLGSQKSGKYSSWQSKVWVPFSLVQLLMYFKQVHKAEIFADYMTGNWYCKKKQASKQAFLLFPLMCLHFKQKTKKSLAIILSCILTLNVSFFSIFGRRICICICIIALHH